MARQPQPVLSSSSRMQSAPINIAYSNRDDQQVWRDNYYRWNHQQQFQFDDDQDEDVQQNHHSENAEDQFIMMQNGFSGGVIEEIEQTSENDNQPDENDVNEQIGNNDEAITQQKIAEMNDDLFEQLLAENERKLRQLISYVENVHLVLK
ncbi:uncharacterized protein CELE_M163.1 [Caenorhabditis elegans]|uniref:Uncharacterized protein n=1 Tax=Caenorhabditis elegans TaxID=6239 RepID=Q93906_CAEEL|nr:Uncharacterized protein CELE_M163.1 [Caenorhabditis elegans]CAB01897.1 Uncharacterized protein CELE_M163.1 [Caenorhabditis elegans]|eukprot:NP_510412.1 Uncharacterized protein CELE_M163.1 [Caenorhabditis elegans]